MKKIYLSVLSLALFTGVNAQITKNYSAAPKSSTMEMAGKHQAYAVDYSKADLWSNDFSNAADWAETNTSVPVTGTWNIVTDPAALPTNGPFTATTAANGYAFINSDAEGGSGTQDAYFTYQGATPIVTTGNPNVSIQFEHNYSIYSDERSIEVSNDGGTTWVPYLVHPGITTGSVAEVFSIDISPTAGDQANVMIRFHYTGAWGWHWAIDDVVIKSTEPYDLKAESAIWGSYGAWEETLPYYMIPEDQIQAISFCGVGSNLGINDVADATYTMDITGAGTFNSSGVKAIVAGAMDTACTVANYTPMAQGAYNATHALTTSNPDTGLPGNDVFAPFTFEVVGTSQGSFDAIYARDNVQAGVMSNSWNSGEGYESGNIFDIVTPTSLDKIDVHIHSATQEGALIFVKLYSIDAATGDFILMDQSDYYEILAADLDAVVTLPLLNGANALAAESYLVVVGTDGDGGATNDLVTATSGDSAPQTTFYYDATDATWYYSTRTPMVRMNFKTSGLEEAENVSKMSVYPNPAVNEATVSFALNNASDVMVNVTDLSGKVVYSTSLGNAAAGTNSVAVNTSSLSNGIYMVNVSTNEVVSTQKLVIKK